MAKSNAVKRLERILFDASPEEYGPKLTRLSAKDQAYILGRIERGENAQVTRKEILRLDKERLERRRGRTSQTTPKGPSIETLRAKARARFQTMLGHLPKYEHDTVMLGTKLMTKDELTFAVSASRSDLQAKAMEPSTPYPDLDIELNAFWYH